MGLLRHSKAHSSSDSAPDTTSAPVIPGNGYGNSYDPGLTTNTASAGTAEHKNSDYLVNDNDSNEEGLYANFSKSQERRLMMKVDLRLIPVLSVLYLLAFIDRTNIANAAVYGLTADLGAARGSNAYNTALTLFFVFYILFEIPSNVILKRLKPHIWLPSCMMLFGLITIFQGLVTNMAGLYATRLFLGLAEAGMFPGCFYLIGMWYKRSEAQKRFSFFFGSTSLAGAFSGLLAAALSNMDGLRGYRAWRWIFIIEGVVTCLFAIWFFWCIPDFPEHAKFLSEQERAFVKLRIQQDQGKSTIDRKITFKDVINVFRDWKIICGGFMYFGLLVPAYGYAFFAPLIISGFNYTPVQTQLFSVPPWAVAFTFAMVVAYFSDLIRHRFGFIVFAICASMTGFAMQLAPGLPNNVKYGGLFLVAAGTYTAAPLIVCWFNMNLGGHHRRAVGSAWQISFGNIGGIVATYAFLPKDSPRYVPGHGICLGFLGLTLISSGLYFIGCYTANRRRESVKDVGETEYEKAEKGDLSSSYRYML